MSYSNYPFNSFPSQTCLNKLRHSDKKRALNLLSQGVHQSEVARRLGINKKTLNYHVKRWVKEGLLIVDTKGYLTIFRPGQRCLKILTGGESGGGKVVRLHHLALKFPHSCSQEFIREHVLLDEVPLRHWSRFIGDISGLKVEVTSKHVIVWASTVPNPSPVAALLRSFQMCTHGAAALSEKYGVDVDLAHPMLFGSKPHYAVPDPVAEAVGDEVIVSAEIGEIDASLGFGEIDFHNLSDVVDYLKMPSKVRDLNDKVEFVLTALEGFAVNIGAHVGAIKEIGVKTEGLGHATENLEKVLKVLSEKLYGGVHTPLPTFPRSKLRTIRLIEDDEDFSEKLLDGDVHQPVRSRLRTVKVID